MVSRLFLDPGTLAHSDFCSSVLSDGPSAQGCSRAEGLNVAQELKSSEQMLAVNNGRGCTTCCRDTAWCLGNSPIPRRPSGP